MDLSATKNSKCVNLPRFGVVCNDAGAANQILAHLSKENIELIGYFTGPAVSIQREYLPHVRVGADLDEVLHSCDILITGTGWSSSLEHEARILAKKHRIFSIAVLDHWVNYESRFVRNGIQQLPDQIWVFDKLAQQSAEKIFPNLSVVLKPSTYRELILSKVNAEVPEKNCFLYLCEPMRHITDAPVPLEIIQIEAFLSKIKNHSAFEDAKIFVRLHPSESKDKYVGVFKNFKELNLKVQNGPLWEAFNECRYVVGFSSYALYIAHLAGRQVFSSASGNEPVDMFDIGRIIPVEMM